MRYCITVTHECNWDCPYCITNTHNKNRDFVVALEHAYNMECGQKVSLSGGEPGLLATGQLLEIIRVLKSKDCEVQIVSNGTIFDHPEVMEVIDGVWYHCSIDMELSDTVNREYPNKTEYMVVLTDNNIHNLEAFLERHSDLQIVLVAGEKVPVHGKTGEYLSVSNALKVALKYKGMISKNNLKYLLGREYQNEVVIL